MKPRMPATALSISAAAIIGIAAFEGFRDRAYDDGVGVQTIGFGTTAGVKPGDRIDPVRALVRLGEDADTISREMAACIKVPVAQHEYDAFASFAYNVGAPAFCRSTLARKLNAGDYAGACAELLRWTKAGGRELAGLVKRRQAEYEQCMGAPA
jgi:lysozyme